MPVVKTGQAHVAARARLMLLLGEQLITDEVAAVSELVKNSYDADAEEVRVTLHDPSNVEAGYIEVWDNGNGMSIETVLSSWLELGTLSKARGADRTPRLSETKKRIFLGEKGLGRLAVHKLGFITNLVTRRMGENVETKLTIDWTLFEQEGFLDQIPIKWEVTEPQIYKNSPKGTCITIRKLRRAWTVPMMKEVQENILALKSPFADFSDFEIEIKVEDENAPEVKIPDMASLVKQATYTFTGSVDESGRLKYYYKFTRPDLPDLCREEPCKVREIKTQQMYTDDRKPTCGPFNVKIYSWDASPEDQKAVFGETSILRQMIRPNSGVKLFRDGFRVYPYGNHDNDWLGMDARRIGQSFELRLSRNQVIGALEISSKTNPQLIDKTDREGLIDNQAYEDFVGLVLDAISTCENERFEDRRKLKKTLGRTRPEDYDKLVFTRNLAALSKMVWEQSKLPGEAKLALRNLIDQARDSLENILAEKEQPLLVAASFGITYLMPTHEIKRNIDEASKILRRMRETSGADDEKINAVISHLRTADSMIHGLAKLSMKSQEEAFPIKRAAESALALMKDKLDRNSIECKIEGTDKVKAKGKENLITILLLNFLDNSFYWLLRKKPNERQIKIFVGEYVNRPTIIVSDSGPGFEDHDINIVTLPFFTRKPDGMGLGLYIADRIARMNGGNLLLLDPNDFPGLLTGANIAVSLQNVEEKRKRS
jgi:signal transduction histidine kinase